MQIQYYKFLLSFSVKAQSLDKVIPLVLKRRSVSRYLLAFLILVCIMVNVLCKQDALQKTMDLIDQIQRKRTASCTGVVNVVLDLLVG